MLNPESRQRIIEWDSSIEQLSYEQILGVPLDATNDLCRDAYYRFAQSFHPDLHPDADPALGGALTRVFQRGAEAYRVLTNPTLRARWVLARGAGALRLADVTAEPDIDLSHELSVLHAHCRSAGAILFAKQAHSAFGRGRAEECLSHLRRALEYEGDANFYLERCLQALELRL